METTLHRVLPIRQDITYWFCFTGAETGICKIKDDSKIKRQTNLDRHRPSQIGTDWHISDPLLSPCRLPLKHVLQYQKYVRIFSFIIGYINRIDLFLLFELIFLYFWKCSVKVLSIEVPGRIPWPRSYRGGLLLEHQHTWSLVFGRRCLEECHQTS